MTLHRLIPSLRAFGLVLAVWAVAVTWTGGPGFGPLGVGASVAQAAQAASDSEETGGNVPGKSLGATSDSEFWRSINHGNVGYVSIPDKKSAVMINRTGELWRTARTDQVLLWGGVLLAGTLAAIVLFAIVYGKFKLHSAPTGRVIPRFSQPERWAHWFVASLFVLLGLTGLVILFGRPVLKPVIGADALGAVANASLQAHNLLGPIFIAALVIMLLMFFKDNLPQRGDFQWALKGGFFSREHPPSWKYNLGEKSWYWLLVVAGAVLCLSGVVMIFPALAGTFQGIEALQVMQLAQTAHVLSAVVLITASLGHIYLGVWGVEGALDSMTLGYVDETWGKEHHRWWAEGEIDKDHVVEGAPQAVLAAKEAEAAQQPAGE